MRENSDNILIVFVRKKSEFCSFWSDRSNINDLFSLLQTTTTDMGVPEATDAMSNLVGALSEVSTDKPSESQQPAKKPSKAQKRRVSEVSL